MSDAPQDRPDNFADPVVPNATAPSFGQSPGFGQSQQAPYGQQQAPVPPPIPTQYPQQAPYGAGHYGYGPVEHPQSQMVFILGIVGIFTGIVSFVAWYMGSQAKKEIEAGAPFPWDGNLKTGYTLGKVFSIIWIVFGALGIVFWVIYMILIFGLLTTYG